MGTFLWLIALLVGLGVVVAALPLVADAVLRFCGACGRSTAWANSGASLEASGFDDLDARTVPVLAGPGEPALPDDLPVLPSISSHSPLPGEGTRGGQAEGLNFQKEHQLQRQPGVTQDPVETRWFDLASDCAANTYARATRSLEWLDWPRLPWLT